MNRGAGKNEIFHGEEYYEMFLVLLNEIHNRYQIKIHAYCLMPNHYHLLLSTPLANLSKAIKHLNGVYTLRHNKLQKTDGPLFRGRFKAIIIDADEYLITLSRYIHLNPVAAGIVRKAEKYRWSSYSAYLHPKIAPYWLNTAATLARFGAKMQRQKYKNYVEEKKNEKRGWFLEKLREIPILGSEVFIKNILQKYLTKNINLEEISGQKGLNKLRMPTVEDIMQVVAEHYHVDIAKLKNNFYKKAGNKPRAIAIYLSCLLINHNLTPYF